jgi:alpha-tubulin suppressor-like RCC1 family protein
MVRASAFALLASAGCGFDASVLSAARADVREGGREASPGFEAGLDAADASAGLDARPSADASLDGSDRGDASGVFTGQYFTCALVLGEGWCFGANVDGALGSGDVQTHLSPARLATPSGFDVLTGGENHTCGLEHGTGAVFCWGYNASGQLGVGDVVARDAPVRVSLPQAAVAVAAGYNHTCAIAADGSLWCWGDNTEGQLGQNDAPGAANAASPVRVGKKNDWLRVAGGQGHTCAIEAPGTMWCFGRNSDSETGTNPAVVQVRTPSQTGTSSDWTDVDIGQNSSCGVRADGSLWCWGDNSFGQLGSTPSSQPVASPAQVGAGTTYARVSIDTFSACALETTGAVACWGRNAEGQLGVGDTTDRYAPTRVGGVAACAAVSVGRFHTCFMQTSGTIYCAGDNSSGELGLGDTVRRDAPTLVTFGP